MDTAVLYGGAVELVLDNRHRYSANGKWAPGVTTVLGVIGKGDGITQWAVNCAIDSLRERLQGELTDAQLEDAFKVAKYAYKGVKQEACDVGTLAHNWLEQYLLGNEQPLPENEQARNSIDAAKKWMAEHDYRTVAVEQLLYSRKYRYCGKLDFLTAEIDGELSLPDWKTSKAIYDSYAFQLAAYQQAYQEETGKSIENRYIIRIDKNTAEFEVKCFPKKDFKKDFKVFKAALTIFLRQRELSKDF